MGWTFERLVGESKRPKPMVSLEDRLTRVGKERRHVALKALTSYASREIETGRLGEREILRRVSIQHFSIPDFST